MIEKIVLNYLEKRVGVKAYMEEEPDMAERYILIEKTGSGGNRFIKKATIVIKSYDNTLEKTAILNEEVKKAMEDIIELGEITKCSLNSDYNFTDTVRKKYRYQAIFNITHY